MSEPAPPPFDPSNPKAAAKAAKAYAKAARPWYKKKRWWVLAAVVVVIIIIVASTSGGNDGPTVVSNGDKNGTGTPSPGSEGAAVGTKDNPAKVGATLELAGTRYTVKNVETKATIESFGTTAAKADGKFVVVTLTLENTKDETHQFSSSAARLVAKDGTSYSPDDENSAYLDNPLIFEDMQPNLPKTGVLLFDVPPAAVTGILLKVSDLFGEGDAYINLGL